MARLYVFMFLLFCTIVSGCAPMQTCTINMSIAQPSTAKALDFSDENIQINFVPGMYGFDLILYNKTNSQIKINWDGNSLTGIDGVSRRVIHRGIRLMDRNSPQAPTIVPPFGTIQDSIIPSELYSLGEYGWYKRELFPGEDKSIYQNKTVSVYMPLEKDGKTLPYNFRFTIRSIVCTLPTTPP